MDALEIRVDSLETHMNERFDRVDKRLGYQVGKIARLEERFDLHEGLA